MTRDIQLTTSYNLAVSTRRSKIAVYANDIVHNIALDNLGDNVTDNQILIKQLSPTYRKLSFKIMDSDDEMLALALSIHDRTAAPSGRHWSHKNDDIIYTLRPGLRGVFEGKWVLDRNGEILAHTDSATTINPWDASWMSEHGDYEGHSHILCDKSIMLVWNVVPITEVVGDIEIGPGTGPGHIEWVEV
jgi:hypothetical protein